MSGLRYLDNVVSLKLDVDRCAGCGMCLEVCPHSVFAVVDGKAAIRDRDACMECGACAGNCPAGAITVKASVGCAAAIIEGMLKGTEPQCGCSGSGKPSKDAGSRCC